MTNRIFKVGQTREQGSFLPPRIEDYVAPDNPVRAIEAYVCALDLAALGFRHAGGDGGAGQPPYDPADLLKLYLYGYLNQVRFLKSIGAPDTRQGHWPILGKLQKDCRPRSGTCSEQALSY